MKGRFRLHPATFLLPLALAFTFLGFVVARRSAHLDFVSTQEHDIPRAPLAAEAKGRSLHDYIPPVAHAPTLTWLRGTDASSATSTRLQDEVYGGALKGAEAALSAVLRDKRIPTRDALPLIAPPLLFIAGSVATFTFVSWLWGLGSACSLVLALVACYPLGSHAWPGVLDSSQLVPWWVLGALLPLAALGRRPGTSQTLAVLSGLFLGSGIAALPAIFGPLSGAVIAAGLCTVFFTTKTFSLTLPWNTWSFAGAVSLVGCCLHAAPSPLTRESLIPEVALAASWVALGLALGSRAASEQKGWKSVRGLSTLALGIVVVVLLWLRVRAETLFPDELALRLSPSSENLAGVHLFSLLQQHPFSAGVWAVVSLPLLSLPAWVAWRQRTTHSGGIALLSFPALALALLGLYNPPLFTATAASLLALWLVAVPAGREAPSLPSLGILVLVSALGAAAALKDPATASLTALSEGEQQRLAERTLAHQLAVRLPKDAVVLAPAVTSSSLAYYGSLNVLRSKADDSAAKVATVAHILRSASLEEALVRLTKENVAALVLPSWDPEFLTLTRLDETKHENRFYDYLQQWSVPGWLRPLAVTLPKSEAGAPLVAQVFLLQEETDRSLSLGRFADFFLETGNTPLASLMLEKLKPFSNNANGLIALAEIHKATGDEAALEKDLRTLLSLLKSGYGPRLVWDRQLSLAVVLAQAGQLEPARKQFSACIQQVDTEKLHTLSPAALYRLLFLAKAFEQPLPSASLEQEARNLLTKELLARLDAKP